MAKKTWTVDIEEVVRYQIEVKAKSAEEAAKKAEDKFFFTERKDHYKWEYMSDVNFDDPELVDEAA